MFLKKHQGMFLKKQIERGEFSQYMYSILNLLPLNSSLADIGRYRLVTHDNTVSESRRFANVC